MGRLPLITKISTSGAYSRDETKPAPNGSAVLLVHATMNGGDCGTYWTAFILVALQKQALARPYLGKLGMLKLCLMLHVWLHPYPNIGRSRAGQQRLL